MNVQIRRSVLTTLTLLCCWLTVAIGAAQFAGGARPRCPPVQARNAQEVIMMEAASHKTGCWRRGADGQLVFTNDTTPDTNYKPPINQPLARPVSPALPALPAGRCLLPAQRLQALAAQAQQACLNDPLYGPNSVGFAPAPACLAADNRAAAALDPYCSCLGLRPNPDPEKRDVGAFYPSVTGGMARRPLPRPARAYPGLCIETGDWVPSPRSSADNGVTIRLASNGRS